MFRVMTLRIDPALLERLREVANAEQRSVSAQVLFLVRKDLESRAGGRKVVPTMGWLARRGPAPDLREFRRARRQLSKALEKRLRRSSK